jgi:ferredoxin
VDKARCDNVGICIDLAPGIFSLDEDDELTVENPVAARHAADANRAATACPRLALRVVAEQMP